MGDFVLFLDFLLHFLGLWMAWGVGVLGGGVFFFMDTIWDGDYALFV